MIVLAGDCRELMPPRGPFDMILADPPYGDTSLAWDRRSTGRSNEPASTCRACSASSAWRAIRSTAKRPSWRAMSITSSSTGRRVSPG